MSLPHRVADFVMSKCVPVSQSVAVIVEHAASATHVGKLTEVPSPASDGHVIVAVCATCVAVLHITSHDWEVVRTWPAVQPFEFVPSVITPLTKAPTAAHEFAVQQVALSLGMVHTSSWHSEVAFVKLEEVPSAHVNVLHA